jgi:hypothetical protein
MDNSWIYGNGICMECCGKIIVRGSERPDADYAWSCANESCPNHEEVHTGDQDTPMWVSF